MSAAPASGSRVLSLIPPMTQLNVPYPSTAYLTGFLRSRGIAAEQADIALGLVLALFSPEGLREIHPHVTAIPPKKRSASLRCFAEAFDRHLAAVGPAVAFLQGRDPSIGHRIAGRHFLPEGPRFAALDVYIDEDGGDPLAWAFGMLGIQDRARHLATLYLDDLADVLRDAVDPRFEFVRYAESLARSQPTFEPLARALAAAPTLVDATLENLTLQAVDRTRPDVVLLSVPFPGSVYAAFRMAQAIKAAHPAVVTVLGGGYVNTELRELKEPRVFDFFDHVTLDDGEQPILALLEHLAGHRPRLNLVRTFARVGGKVRYFDSQQPDVPFADVGTPTWDGLPLDRYLSLLDLLNPMHRL